MNNNVHKPVIQKNAIYRKKYLKRLLYKSIIVLALILVLILIKKLNLSSTNNVLGSLKNNIEYEFNLIEDSKKLYVKAQQLLDSSLETVGVLNSLSPKFNAPIAGSIYRSFDQMVVIDGNKIKNGGIDIKVINGEDPIAISNGTVTDIHKSGNKGYFISIKNGDMEITYGYISKPYVEEGDEIVVGEKLGELGNTKDGNKYLRIEIEVKGEKVDPTNYISFSEII
ncbi:M23 family metallopeptidase [Tissierella sp. Yu-01]|uniref:M23 family metallopeptidase n=1 Tax=Tissierella sp. Yu-01 TaxID=3035694 RepID=UPI00240D5EDF|nr:M23 family metallopeptidase [Tissierella sp. Yu-01]WFA09494.1 M23 family metallopeptidase [Tissierella sp. Yu-01]